MLRTHIMRWVEHDAGYHVYLWLEVTDRGHRERRQVDVHWVPRAEGQESVPRLLLALSAILQLPLGDRPMPPAQPGRRPLGGHGGKKPSTLT